MVVWRLAAIYIATQLAYRTCAYLRVKIYDAWPATTVDKIRFISV